MSAKKVPVSSPAPEPSAPTSKKPAPKAAVAPTEEVVTLPPNVKALLDQKQHQANEILARLNADIENGLKFFLEGRGLSFSAEDILTLAPDNTHIRIQRKPKNPAKS